jgi:hypothetical protein
MARIWVDLINPMRFSLRFHRCDMCKSVNDVNGMALMTLLSLLSAVAMSKFQ